MLLALWRRALNSGVKFHPSKAVPIGVVKTSAESLRLKWRDVRTTLRSRSRSRPRAAARSRTPGVVVAALKAHRIRQKKERLLAGGDWQAGARGWR